MRDVSRIPKVLRAIHEIWSKQPDTRFNQLIHNLQYEYSNSKSGAYKRELWEKEEHKHFTAYGRHHIVDLFHVEDEDFLLFLESKLKEYSNEKRDKGL